MKQLVSALLLVAVAGLPAGAALCGVSCLRTADADGHHAPAAASHGHDHAHAAVPGGEAGITSVGGHAGHACQDHRGTLPDAVVLSATRADDGIVGANQQATIAAAPVAADLLHRTTVRFSPPPRITAPARPPLVLRI